MCGRLSLDLADAVVHRADPIADLALVPWKGCLAQLPIQSCTPPLQARDKLRKTCRVHA